MTVPPGRQRGDTNVIMDGRNKATQATAGVQRKPGEPVPVGPNVNNREGETSSDGKMSPQPRWKTPYHLTATQVQLNIPPTNHSMTQPW